MKTSKSTKFCLGIKVNKNYTLLYFSCIVFAISCQDTSEKITPKQTLYRVVLSNPEIVDPNTTQTLDINHDGLSDFTCSVLLIGTSTGVISEYRINSLRNNLVILESENAAALQFNTKIGSNLQNFHHFWGVDSGVIARSKLSLDGQRVIEGSWAGKIEAYIGLNIPINGKNYYGWIKVKNELESNRLLIMEYAISVNPDDSIFIDSKDE